LGDGLTDFFEQGFGGVPPNDSISIDNPDTGNTGTATGSAGAGSTIMTGELTVIFPPGTTVDLVVDQKILIKFVSDGYPGNPNALPKVEINAVNTAGQTKTVKMPIGIGNNICIVDQTTATIESLDTPSCIGDNTTLVSIPPIMGDVNMESGTAEPSILTTYTVTRISATHVSVEGIVHSALGSFKDSDRDTIRDADDICPNTPQGAEVILSGPGMGCTPTQALQSLIDELQDIVDNNPRTELADELDDIVSELQEAKNELTGSPPDNEEAVDEIQDAIEDIEELIDDGLLDATQGSKLVDLLEAAEDHLSVVDIDEENDDDNEGDDDDD